MRRKEKRQMLRAAIVGLGWWGRNLVESVQGKIDEIGFTACCTRSPGKATEFCARHSIALVDSYDSILGNKSIDAVVLATPPSAHAGQVIAAAAAGKHVFVEKPFTLTSDMARKAIVATQEAGVMLAVGFNRRFHPSMDELRSRIRDGKLGAIAGFLIEHTAPGGANIRPDEWRANQEETPAGAMTGIGIHIVDAMIDLFGAIAEVHCMATRRVAPLVDDTTAVLVRFKSGLSGVFYASFVTVPNYRIAVYGANGVAEILKPTQDEFRFAPLSDPKAGHLAQMKPEVIVTPGFDTLQAELKEFAACVREMRPYPISADQVLHGVEAFEAIAKSAKLGVPVVLG
jgi:predicted dehydrogenase